MACCKTNSDFVTCEATLLTGLVDQKRVVHYFCALSLPEVFQLNLYSSKPKFTVDFKKFPTSEQAGLLIPKNLERFDHASK